jgi:hypothetical protein
MAPRDKSSNLSVVSDPQENMFPSSRTGVESGTQSADPAAAMAGAVSPANGSGGEDPSPPPTFPAAAVPPSPPRPPADAVSVALKDLPKNSNGVGPRPVNADGEYETGGLFVLGKFPGVSGGTDDYDPFDEKNLSLRGVLGLDIGAKKLLTVVPCKPPGKQDWFRIHPEFCLSVGMLKLEEDGDFYIFTKRVEHLAEPLPGYFKASLVIGVTSLGITFVWPVKSPVEGRKQDRYITTAIEAANRGRKEWMRIQWNNKLKAYDLYSTAKDYGDPRFPDLPHKEVVRIALQEFLVDTPDHEIFTRW